MPTGQGEGPQLRPRGFCNLLCLLSRQLCLLLNAENIFHSMADILLREEDLKFASTMVHTLNTILLTSTELFQLRNQLKDLKTLVLVSGPGLGFGPVCTWAFRWASPAPPQEVLGRRQGRIGDLPGAVCSTGAPGVGSMSAHPQKALCSVSGSTYPPWHCPLAHGAGSVLDPRGGTQQGEALWVLRPCQGQACGLSPCQRPGLLPSLPPPWPCSPTHTSISKGTLSGARVSQHCLSQALGEDPQADHRAGRHSPSHHPARGATVKVALSLGTG